MKLCFLTAQATDIEKAALLGFDGVELDASVFGDAFVGALDMGLVDVTAEACAQRQVEITALAYYDVSFNANTFNSVGPERVLVEHEDNAYSRDRFDEGLVRGWQVLHPLIHPQA